MMHGGADVGPADVSALPRTRSSSAWQRAWRPFWVLPMAIVVASVLAGYLVPELDRLVGDELPYVFPGGPSGARDMLGTIAGAMISVTGLVFSITMVVVQLASSQYSPRVLGDFLSNRVTQATLGIFAASFTYALTVLRSVRGESGDGGAFVPQVSVTLGFVLVLASVGMFLAFIHHITRSIQVSSIVSHLGSATVDVVDGYYPEPTGLRALPARDSWQPEGSLEARTVEARQHGAIVEVDHRELVARAVDLDAVIEVLLPVGDFAAEGRPVLRIWHEPGLGALGEDALDALRGLVVVEQDRIPGQDPALGVRKLIDIADRALSPGINDPATAVQVLDEVHRILRRAVTRADLPALVRSGGVVRLVHRPQRVEQLIDLALAEPLHYGRGSLQVPRRIEAMLDDLAQVALAAHRPAIARWRERAQAVVAAQQQPQP
ncbi:DUF2254 domain-containing protein [Agrococcus sp. TF02-05]|nr:DUF2254 domain-containing protein [Agrococcus sp. TF02-05]